MVRRQGNQKASWRKTKTRPLPVGSEEFGGRGRERRKILFLVSMTTTIAVVLSAVLIWMLFKQTDRDVPLIVAAVTTSYNRTSGESLYTPPNPFALEDVKLLKAWFDKGALDNSQNVKFVGNVQDRTGYLSKSSNRFIASLTEPLKEVEAGGPNDDMIALFICAHGFVHQTVPYFAMGDSVPFQTADDEPAEKTWISVKEVREAIAEALKQRKSDSPRVVIFIDASRAGPQWDWGQFTEQFTESCEQALGTDKNQLAVILSASPGERSWWDPRAGNSLFVQCLVDGLTGAIKPKGQTITVGDIVSYLQKEVGVRAADIWAAKQTPKLLNQEALTWDFISMPGNVSGPQLPQVAVEQLRKDFKAVDKLWEKRSELATQTHSPLAFDPLGWSALDKKLARLDAVLLAGDGYREEFTSLRNECVGILSGFKAGPNSSQSFEDLPELAIQDYFHRPEAFTAELEETIQAWRKKPEIAAVQVPLLEHQATRFLSAWLEEKEFAPDSVALAAQLLEDKNLVTSGPGPRLLESQMIRMLSADDLSHLDRSMIAAIVGFKRHQPTRHLRTGHSRRILDTRSFG